MLVALYSVLDSWLNCTLPTKFSIEPTINASLKSIIK